MTISRYNPKTQEGLDFHEYCEEVARRTGRIVFGQLWIRDPGLNDIMSAIFSRSIAEAIDTPSPLLEYLNRSTR